MSSKKLKIVHINTSPVGGAGVAAIRLHEALLNNNIESYFICIADEPIQVKNAICLPFKKPSLFKRIVNRLYKPVMDVQLREKLIKQYQPVSEFLGTPYSDYRVEDIQEVKDADIINLHWISGFINYPTFFKKIKAPVVWTIHDLSPFMGCFNYPIDEENNPQLKEVNAKFYEKKMAALKEYNHPIHLVAPSKWIMEEAKKYKQFASLLYHHIPNGIDRKKLNYIDINVARETLGLPQDTCVLLFVSEYVENRRKRFDKILALVERLSDKKIIFVAVGNETNIVLNKQIQFTGRITSLEKLNLFYAAADYFLMPSLEDNFPNVVLEALFCGTPVISNNAGGMKDIIDDTNGFLVDDFDVKTIAALVEEKMTSSNFFDRKKISAAIKEKYAVENMANSYIEIYNEITAGKN